METILKYNSSIDEFVSLAKKHNAQIIQYRDKINSTKDQIENLKHLKDIFLGTVLVNDYIFLAEYCDGVHVGQDDIIKINIDKNKAIKTIRETIGDKILGLSTHNIQEVQESNNLDIDYIGLGAYRATDTKDVDNILGEDISNVASYSQKEVAAIGGVLIDDEINNITFNVVASGL